MRLSIIIVNYNVRYFLEQCLLSVYNALEGIEAEVFVVDNHSVDGSVEMLREKFPQVKLIANAHNPGFSKANNQAIQQARGEYILLLNPDTVVEENTFSASLRFMDAHPDAGGLGIKMIDGRGHFLPESKRGLPTPWVSFCKISGLTALFPHSKRLAKYYLGHLDKDQNQEVEILAGAYMLMRKQALEKVGLLDEDFFMYGEDIDLSYRILKGGYKNYYLAESSIIHYKGESTKKGSLNYVFVFYKAMVIFARKHFSSRYASAFSFFINIAIYLRAGISVLSRFIKALSFPFTDAVFLAAGLIYIKEYWENNHRFIQGGEYSPELVRIAFPAYILFWLLGLYFNGAYDKNTRATNIFKGVFAGTIGILVVYSLLPESLRFSRAIIVLGAFWAGLILPLWRYLAQVFLKIPIYNLAKEKQRLLIVGSGPELKRIRQMVMENRPGLGFVGFVSPTDTQDEEHLGVLKNLSELCRVFSADEVVFCSSDVSGQEIMAQMSKLSEQNVEIKIAPPESQFIIGSNSINTQGDWYAVEFNAITKPANSRAKRLFDFLSALLMLMLSPVLMWFQKHPLRFLRNVVQVLAGRKSWVGYDREHATKALPKLKPGVLPATQNIPARQLDKKTISQLNILYAKNYRLQTDVYLVLGNLRALGS